MVKSDLAIFPKVNRYGPLCYDPSSENTLKLSLYYLNVWLHLVCKHLVLCKVQHVDSEVILPRWSFKHHPSRSRIIISSLYAHEHGSPLPILLAVLNASLQNLVQVPVSDPAMLVGHALSVLEGQNVA